MIFILARPLLERVPTKHHKQFEWLKLKARPKLRILAFHKYRLEVVYFIQIFQNVNTSRFQDQLNPSLIAL